jgi:hypothetical protein
MDLRLASRLQRTKKSAAPTPREDRIPPNQKILCPNLVQVLSVKLETEGEEATSDFLETLGCSDVAKVMNYLACL